ncbi:MAG: hypothetical protein ACRDJ9_35270, partial [Dehalococcoidia bacterium]
MGFRRAGAMLALAAAIAALAPTAATSAAERDGARRGVIFVANSEDGTVTVIDARTLRRNGEINVIPDGDSPPLDDPLHALPYPAVRLVAGE